MKSSDFGRNTLCVSIAAATLAACGGSQPPIGAPGAMPQSLAIAMQAKHGGTPATVRVHEASAAESVIYSFEGGTGSMADGANPRAGLISLNGTLYGTTFVGGAYGLPRHDPRGFGTVFSVTTSGTETVLHRFQGAGDGKYPYADVIDVNGTLYGTTGGTFLGTVFSITPYGAETVLHKFKGGARDGAQPEAGMINVKGTLYGTTAGGGKYRRGTVFSITPSGAETVLHSFGASGDGALPLAGLVNLNGTLYGTTYAQNLRSGYGTVFKVTRSGKETVLHSFKGGAADGAEPLAGLLNVNGTLYGTTYVGGAYGDCNGEGGCGTVFSITPSGKVTLLYSFGFAASGSGEEPEAGLINVNGTLYGTTYMGGLYNSGTVFSVTTSGTKTVYSFKGGASDGAEPEAGLVDVDGTLYGTTAFGGASNDGTVYSLTGI